MKFIILSIAIFAVSCSNNKEENMHLDNNIIETSHDRLSDVIHSLLETEVRGYVVISKSALEYSSIQMAREDKTEPKAIVKFDVNRFDHHTPKNIGGDRFHHWGSSLICRKVIADHGDVVEVLTLDTDEGPEKLGHGTLGADYLFELTTFVRKIDLAPVLNTTYKIEFNDKTFVEFQPGLVVGIPWDSGETKRAVSIQQLHFEFSIPDSLLKLSYQPKMKKLKNIDNEKMLNEDALLFLDGKKFCKVSEIRNKRLRTPISYKQVGEDYMVEFFENGISFKLITNMTLTDSYMPNIERPLLTNRFDTQPRWYYRLNEGIPIYWEDGRLAGKMRQYLGHYSHVGPGESKYCNIMPELFENMPLCFKLNDIEVHDNE